MNASPCLGSKPPTGLALVPLPAGAQNTPSGPLLQGLLDPEGNAAGTRTTAAHLPAVPLAPSWPVTLLKVHRGLLTPAPDALPNDTGTQGGQTWISPVALHTGALGASGTLRLRLHPGPVTPEPLENYGAMMGFLKLPRGFLHERRYFLKIIKPKPKAIMRSLIQTASSILFPVKLI